MSWSLGETRALAVKAARGAGLNWGLAEEAGFAVHWLQRHGGPGVEALVRFLSWTAKPDNTSAPAWAAADAPGPAAVFSPLEIGAAILDAGQAVPAQFGRIRQPVLLVPFLAAAGQPSATCLIWDDTEIRLSQSGIGTLADRPALLIGEAECRIENGGGSGPALPLCRRVPDTEADHIKALEKFSALTYAPATEQSRLAGAGAGLSDND